jgi:hypothetical protein
VTIVSVKCGSAEAVQTLVRDRMPVLELASSQKHQRARIRVGRMCERRHTQQRCLPGAAISRHSDHDVVCKHCEAPIDHLLSIGFDVAAEPVAPKPPDGPKDSASFA